MNFELTDEQQGLVETTRSLLATKSPITRVRELMDSGSGFDAELWRHGAEVGWPGLAIAEADGGLGQGCVDLALVAVELGRALAGTPFISTVVTADALSHTGTEQAGALLPTIADGSSIGTWAFAEFGQPWSIDAISTQAQRHGSGFVLHGAKASVPDADVAGILLVDALLDGAPARFVVPADSPGVGIRRQQTLDVARSYCDVTFDGVALESCALLDCATTAASSIARTMALNTVLTCAELVGIGQRLLAMTVDYVKDRVQFGKPVGSFQAVKHKCADMRIWVQASTAATYHSAMALDADHPSIERSVSSAKAYVSDAINRVAGNALQLHGGIGFTWEHDLHLYLRRARVGSLLCGDATHHRELLCRQVESAPEIACH